MFGKNFTRSRDHAGPGLMLNVQGTPFLTIQGEGPFAGLPATFVRLWGCHLKCAFCDTDFESDNQATSYVDIAYTCAMNKARLVVLTGGEPMRQNIGTLINRLQANGHLVQIETSGSFWFPNGYTPKVLPEIVVSPKTPFVHDMIADHASTWKYIVTTKSERDLIDGLPITDTQGGKHPRKLARPPANIEPWRVYVQPMDEQDVLQNAWNLALCALLARTHGYRVSLQQHKIIGVP